MWQILSLIKLLKDSHMDIFRDIQNIFQQDTSVNICLRLSFRKKQNQPPEVFYKKWCFQDVSKNRKAPGLWPATLLLKRLRYRCKFCKIFKNTFYRTPWGDCFLKQQQRAEYSLFCTSGQEMWYSSQIPDNQYYA